MQSAALLLLASGMGVMFGWQPMPDGSERYEYVVQLEPELVATLKKGQSIPISGEVPDDIRPIGRIRVTIGNDPLPRQKLITAHKPLPEPNSKKSLDGVIRTQYTVPPVESTGAGRYPAQPQSNPPILPPNDTTQKNTNQPFAQALQNGSPLANAPAPKTNEFFPPSNNPSQPILPQNQQHASNPGQQSRNPLSNTNNNRLAQNAFNQQNQSQRNNNLVTTGQNTQPPAAANTPILPFATKTQNNPLAGPITPRNTQPSQATLPNWQSYAPTSPINQTTSPISPPATNTVSNPNAIWPNSPQQTTNQGGLQPPPFAAQGQNQTNTPTNTPSDRYATRPLTSPQAPPLGNNIEWITKPEQSPLSSNTVHNPQPTSNPPSINKGLLNKPADAAYQTASLPSHVNDRADLSTAKGQKNNNPQTPPQQATNPTSEKPDTFMLVLSWVILSGSGIGNVYLLWNYFDVRHKYRGIVHNTRDTSHRYSSLD